MLFVHVVRRRHAGKAEHLHIRSQFSSPSALSSSTSSSAAPRGRSDTDAGTSAAPPAPPSPPPALQPARAGSNPPAPHLPTVGSGGNLAALLASASSQSHDPTGGDGLGLGLGLALGGLSASPGDCDADAEGETGSKTPSPLPRSASFSFPHQRLQHQHQHQGSASVRERLAAAAQGLTATQQRQQQLLSQPAVSTQYWISDQRRFDNLPQLVRYYRSHPLRARQFAFALGSAVPQPDLHLRQRRVLLILVSRSLCLSSFYYE